MGSYQAMTAEDSVWENRRQPIQRLIVESET